MCFVFDVMRESYLSVNRLYTHLGVQMWTDAERDGFRHIPDNAMVRLACGGAVPQIAPLSLLDFRLAVGG